MDNCRTNQNQQSEMKVRTNLRTGVCGPCQSDGTRDCGDWIDIYSCRQPVVPDASDLLELFE